MPADVGSAVGQAALLQRPCPILQIRLVFPPLVPVLIEEDRSPSKSPGMVGQQGDHLLVDEYLPYLVYLGVGNLPANHRAFVPTMISACRPSVNRLSEEKKLSDSPLVDALTSGETFAHMPRLTNSYVTLQVWKCYEVLLSVIRGGNHPLL